MKLVLGDQRDAMDASDAVQRWAEERRGEARDAGDQEAVAAYDNVLSATADLYDALGDLP